MCLLAEELRLLPVRQNVLYKKYVHAFSEEGKVLER